MTELIPLPITGGAIGAGAATASLQAKKTIQVTQLTGTVVIEASNDGGSTWCQVAAFSGPVEDQTVTIAAAMMRVNAENGDANRVQVVAERGLIRSGSLPAAPLGGSGAAFDAEAFGCLTSVVVAAFDGAGSVNIEVSGSGLANEWSTAWSFQGNGCETKDVSARFIRVTSNGATADVSVGSEDPSAVGGLVPTRFIWRPEDPAGDRGNVYTGTGVAGFAAVHAACRNVVDSGLGIVELVFDSTFSSFMAPGDLDVLEPFCQIPDSSGEPSGAWDLEGIVATTPQNLNFGLGRGNITFQATPPGEEAFVENLTVIRGGVWLHDGTTHSPIIMDNDGIMINAELSFVTLKNTEATALPMIRLADATFFGFLCMVVGPFDQLGAHVHPVDPDSPAPLLDINGGAIFIDLDTGGFKNNTITDSDPGGGSFIEWNQYDDGAGAGRHNSYTWDQPNLPVATFISINNNHRPRHRIGPIGDGASPVFPPVTNADSPYQAGYNETVLVDTTGGAVNILMPKANPPAGETVRVRDVGGDVAANPITITPYALDAGGNRWNAGAVADEVDDGAGPAATTTIIVPFQCSEYEADGGSISGIGTWLLMSTNQ